MEGKVSQLAEKLLKEGVEKGEAEKSKIIEAARNEADKIIKEAKAKAASIIEEADAKAEETKKNAESEIKLSGTQALVALKQKIVDLVSLKTVDESVKKALSDSEVMVEYIGSVLANWKDDATLDIILPETERETMEKELAVAIKQLMDKEVTVSFSKALKGGFQIGPVDGSYKITFSDDDFASFFTEYLRPKIRTIIFGE